MTNKHNKERQEVPLESVVLSQAYTLQALINVLEKKGILTREEVLREFEMMKEVLTVNTEDDLN